MIKSAAVNAFPLAMAAFRAAINVVDSGGGGGGGGDASIPLPGTAKLCVKLWRLKSQFLRNTLPHAEQWYGLISVCVNRWVFRFERWLKLRLHTGHLCGDSSKCNILCTASVRDWQNPLPHSVHLNGFSFEWIYLNVQQNERQKKGKERNEWKKQHKSDHNKLSI